LTPTSAGLSVLIEDLNEVHASVEYGEPAFWSTGKAATDAIHFKGTKRPQAWIKSLPWLTRGDVKHPGRISDHPMVHVQRPTVGFRQAPGRGEDHEISPSDF
jgi:hypothetical protein